MISVTATRVIHRQRSQWNEIKNRHISPLTFPPPCTRMLNFLALSSSFTSLRVENSAHWLSRHFSNYDRRISCLRISVWTLWECVSLKVFFVHEFVCGLLLAAYSYSVITCWQQKQLPSCSRFESSELACCVWFYAIFGMPASFCNRFSIISSVQNSRLILMCGGCWKLCRKFYNCWQFHE